VAFTDAVGNRDDLGEPVPLPIGNLLEQFVRQIDLWGRDW
jgi:hypothetical protein